MDDAISLQTGLQHSSRYAAPERTVDLSGDPKDKSSNPAGPRDFCYIVTLPKHDKLPETKYREMLGSDS